MTFHLYGFPDRRLGSVAGLRDITTTATIDPSTKKEKKGLKQGVHWPYIVKGDGGQPLSCPMAPVCHLERISRTNVVGLVFR
jgi:hypothetical protein